MIELTDKHVKIWSHERGRIILPQIGTIGLENDGCIWWCRGNDLPFESTESNLLRLIATAKERRSLGAK
jgi:hypothetical protein